MADEAGGQNAGKKRFNRRRKPPGAMVWSQPEALELIEVVETYEALWNKHCKEYKETPNKERIWNCVAAELNKPSDACRYKWSLLIDQLRNANERLPTGWPGDCTGVWWGYEKMSFMLQHIKSRKTHRNVDDDGANIDIHTNTDARMRSNSPSQDTSSELSLTTTVSKGQERRNKRARKEESLDSIESVTGKTSDLLNSLGKSDNCRTMEDEFGELVSRRIAMLPSDVRQTAKNKIQFMLNNLENEYLSKHSGLSDVPASPIDSLQDGYIQLESSALGSVKVVVVTPKARCICQCTLPDSELK